METTRHSPQNHNHNTMITAWQLQYTDNTQNSQRMPRNRSSHNAVDTGNVTPPIDHMNTDTTTKGTIGRQRQQPLYTYGRRRHFRRRPANTRTPQTMHWRQRAPHMRAAARARNARVYGARALGSGRASPAAASAPPQVCVGASRGDPVVRPTS